MIPIKLAPEYADFDKDVRQKGKAFLRYCPRPKSRQFKKHRYWTDALEQLHSAYRGLCAYTTKQLVHTGSVDHFLPKSKYPDLAYEWDNFRLARQKINSNKGDSEDIVDPFQMGQGWFTLDLPSCLIRPGRNLPPRVRQRVETTIGTLGLNDDEKLVDERHGLLVALADGDLTLRFLEGHYPFLAREVVRQGVEGSLREIFERPLGT